MEESIHIPSWLHFLRRLYPPNGTILVGAGSGNGDWVTLLSSWGNSNVLLVEADKKKYQHLSALVQTKDDWQARQQLVAEKEEDVIFYMASNSVENGLIDPQTLCNIWPNIETRHEVTLPATTLASLQNECVHYANWLIVDCLPGIPIIVGAGDTLQQFDVVVLRMLLGQDLLLESLSQLNAVDEFMSELGFRCIAVEPERHPALGHGLYVRDLPRIVQEQLEQNNQLHNELLFAEKRVVEKSQRLDKAKEDRSGQITELKTQLSLAVQLKDEQAKLAMERQEQLEQATKSRDKQIKLVAESKQRQTELKQALKKEVTTAREQSHIGQLTEKIDSTCRQVEELNRDRKKIADQAAQQTTAQKRLLEELTTAFQLTLQQLDEARQSQSKAAVQAQVEAAKREAKFCASQELWKKEKVAMLHSQDMAIADAVARCEVLTNEKVQFEKLIEDSELKFKNLCKTVELTIQREVTNAVVQIEAFSTLQGYLSTGELMPALHGWPVSPDFGVLLVQLLEKYSFDAIIEFGSGSSTLLIARTLTHLVQKRPQQTRPVQLAFEHLEKYRDDTADLLIGAKLRDEVMLVLAPLVPTKTVAGVTSNYYDPGDALTQVAERLMGIEVPRILAIVDGPPESIGPLARYPALEMLLDAFPRQQGFILLDDYRRSGEQEIVRHWEAQLNALGIDLEVSEYPVEKKACLIRFDSSL